MKRCDWAKSELMQRYHDTEWGVPLHDDTRLFEFIILEGAQAGLSWEIVLKKRESYRKAFDGFDAQAIARFGPKKIRTLLADPGIIRNKLKVNSAILNAQAMLKIQQEFGSFDAYLWSFVDGKPIVNRRRSMKDIPPRSAESDALSKDLLKRGFKFVGSTICYALMQAVGMVNDHLVTCARYKPLSSARGLSGRPASARARRSS
jgi:DNA-3-methyladenine glycosylase I